MRLRLRGKTGRGARRGPAPDQPGRAQKRQGEQQHGRGGKSRETPERGGRRRGRFPDFFAFRAFGVRKHDEVTPFLKKKSGGLPPAKEQMHFIKGEEFCKEAKAAALRRRGGNAFRRFADAKETFFFSKRKVQ